MNSLDFPVSINKNSPRMDMQILRWAKTWLKNSDGDADLGILKRCSVQKLNWFTCYLFPQLENSRLYPIGELFFCLFILDDLLDLMDREDAENFLSEMSTDKLELNSSLLSSFGLPVDACYLQVLERFPEKVWKEEFRSIWNNYIKGLQWESNNRKENRTPTLDEYQTMRPHSSGAFIAIHMLNAAFDRTNESKGLIIDVARYICLSNDLVSSAKEGAMGDIHNEVLLLSIEHGFEVAEKIVKGEISYLQKKIKNRGLLLRQTSEECKAWVDNLFLLVGGCLFWSWESDRYSESIEKAN